MLVTAYQHSCVRMKVRKNSAATDEWWDWSVMWGKLLSLGICM